MTPLATLEQIRDAAQVLANRHNDTAGCSVLLNAEIKAVIGPVLDRYKLTLDQRAAAEAEAMHVLDELLAANPQLFLKPRSLTVDGVRCGYKKEPDGLDWTDDGDVIARIKALRPDLAPLLIRTQESLVVDAVAGLAPEDLRMLGIRAITGADRRFITLGDNDIERLAKIIRTDASKRQGEDDDPAKTKSKAKTRAKEGVPA
jgi:hypothetical protein